jgi:4-hydroxy-tetrahydrodipicolinate synthase
LQLADHPNILGIKQAVAGIDEDTLHVLSDAPERFCVLAGDDAFVLPIILMGGSGAISAAAHLRTHEFVELIAAGLQGRVDAARRRAGTLLKVALALFAEPSPAVIKSVLHAQGRIRTPNVRSPLTNASAAATARALDLAEPALQ